MKVTVQQDTVVKFFKDITKVRTFLGLDMFENKIEIFQGKKKTVFKESEINGFEVETY